MANRHRYTCHLDSNHMEIKEFFIKSGASVYDAARVGGGFPDLVIGWRGQTFLVEVKDPDKGKLKETQIKFIDSWKGFVHIVHNIEEAQSVLKSTFKGTE